MDRAWYRTFFEGLAVDFWRHAATPQWTQGDIELAWRELHLAPDNRVLDCPCGTGRHALELASRGCVVTGVDISRYSLDLARQDAAAAGMAIDYREGDMFELGDLPVCDAAMTLGNSFGYLDHAGTVQFVNAIAGALRPGGRWLLDCGAAAESLLPKLQPEMTYEASGICMVARNKYLADRSCLETTYEFAQNGKTETKANWHFVFTVAEIRRMLAAAGLYMVALYGSTAGEPYLLGSQMLYLVAEKPA